MTKPKNPETPKRSHKAKPKETPMPETPVAVPNEVNPIDSPAYLLIPPPKIQQTVLIFQVPAEVKSFLDNHAKATSTSTSALVRSFIAAGIDALTKEA